MLRRLVYLLASLVGGVLVLFAAAFGYAQTRLAKDQIGALIERQLSSDTRTAAIEGLAGLLPFDVRIGRFALGDSQGTWLAVEDARVKIEPLALFSGKIHVEQAGARRVVLARLPAEEPASPRGTSMRLPSPPELPPVLPVSAIDRVTVETLELGAAILGEPARFALDGRLASRQEGQVVEASLELRRTDAETAHATLALGLDLVQSTLDLTVEAEETGGLAGRLLGRPDAGPARFSLAASGPLSDLGASLRAEVERLMRAEAQLRLGWTAHPRLQLSASLVAADGALAEPYSAFLGREANIAVTAGEIAPGLFALDRLEVRTAALTAAGSGRVAVEAGRIEGRMTALLPDLSLASPLLGMPLAGSLALAAEALPEQTQPAIALRLEGRDLRVDTAGLATFGADLRLVPMAPLAQGFAGVEMTGTLELRGASLRGQPLEPESQIEIALDVGIPSSGPLAIRMLRATGERLALEGRGSFDPVRLVGDLDLALAATDLARLREAIAPPPLPLPPLAGTARLDAKLQIAEGISTIKSDLRLVARELSGLPRGAAELLGPAPELSGELRYVRGEALQLSGLEIRGAAARLSGELGFGLAREALFGRFALDLPRLAVLAPILGDGLEGRAILLADLAGTMAAPELTLKLEAAPLALVGQAIDRAVFEATAAGPIDRPAGELRLRAVRGSEAASLISRYRLAPETLELTGLTLEAPATRMTGDLRLGLVELAAQGQLQGAIEDLAALEGWIGERLAGKLRLASRFTFVDGRQDVRLESEIVGLAGRFGEIARAETTVELADALGSPRLRAILAVRDFARPDLVVSAASAEVTGPLSDLAMVAEARGERAEPFALRARAELALRPTKSTLVLRSLAGTLGARRIELRRPATAVLENGTLAIDELDLFLGEAEIRGGLQLEPRRVRGFARIDRLPLSWLAAFGGPALVGRAQLAVQLDGHPAAPRLAISGNVRGLRPADDLLAELPAVDLTWRGEVASGRFVLDVALEQSGGKANGRISGPLRLSLTPPAIAVDPTAAISGNLDARIDIAALAALVGVEGQKIEGPLALALRLSGTPAAPALAGTARIEGGRIEDSLTGLTVSDLRLQIEAEGKTLRLAELRAGDGREGELEASGALRFDEGRGFLYSARVKLDDFVVADVPFAFVLADASLDLAGDARRGTVIGRVEIDRAEIGLPSGGGAEIPQLPVIEIDGTDTVWPELVRAEPSAGLPYELALRLQLDMPGRVFVRGRGLESEWGGSLAVRGTAAAPLVEGSIGLRRGYLDLLDRRFTLREGEIRFGGADPFSPFIHLVATAANQDVTAVARLEGPASDPRLLLESDPALPQDEILSRLLFGRDVSRITPIQGLKLAAALQRLEGGTGLDLLGSLREAIGVDTLDIGGESPAEAYVSAGRYVAENVYVEVRQGLATGGMKARVEIELTNRVSVATETGNGGGGVEVEWRYDY
ncbi:Translocation and assembly module TamB [bacterium HR40]|nr:Translocation and assembly module TamB [bacterium HR40]